ncbi:MAG: hypothetical protein HWQ35_04340 [Nostoc sp. NMS1]|nr:MULTISPECIES: hypothetical protein [unclassified Nostoc]MBN3905826.1 hypothetical protein [Nostoc sp. NMS1]
MKPETTAWNAVVLNYYRLIQIHKIEFITSPWSGNSNTDTVSNQVASELIFLIYFQWRISSKI